MGRRGLTRVHNLYREHGRLVNVMFIRPGGLTRSEAHRLNLIRGQLDIIEMSAMRFNFERMRRMVEQSRKTAALVQAFLDLVLPYMPPELRPPFSKEAVSCPRIGNGDRKDDMNSNGLPSNVSTADARFGTEENRACQIGKKDQTVDGATSTTQNRPAK